MTEIEYNYLVNNLPGCLLEAINTLERDFKTNGGFTESDWENFYGLLRVAKTFELMTDLALESEAFRAGWGGSMNFISRDQYLKTNRGGTNLFPNGSLLDSKKNPLPPTNDLRQDRQLELPSMKN